jgi:hypothetical protein
MNILGFRATFSGIFSSLNPKIFIKNLQEEKLLLKVALNPKIFIKNLQEEKLVLKVALSPKIFIKNLQEENLGLGPLSVEVFLPVSF